MQTKTTLKTDDIVVGEFFRGRSLDVKPGSGSCLNWHGPRQWYEVLVLVMVGIVSVLSRPPTSFYFATRQWAESSMWTGQQGNLLLARDPSLPRLPAKPFSVFLPRYKTITYDQLSWCQFQMSYPMSSTHLYSRNDVVVVVIIVVIFHSQMNFSMYQLICWNKPRVELSIQFRLKLKTIPLVVLVSLPKFQTIYTRYNSRKGNKGKTNLLSSALGIIMVSCYSVCKAFLRRGPTSTTTRWRSNLW